MPETLRERLAAIWRQIRDLYDRAREWLADRQDSI
jgi:hypothetical protein